MSTYQGLILVRASVEAENERAAREKLRDLAVTAGLAVEQVTSVRNLSVRVVSDGTNGPRETISAKLSSDAISIPSVFGVGED